MTLISLPPGPLFKLACLALKRQLTAAWLSLASILIRQLDPPTMVVKALKPDPKPEAHAVIAEVFPVLLQTCLEFFSLPGAVDAVSALVLEKPSTLTKSTESGRCTIFFRMHGYCMFYSFGRDS
jgi:hypothetical protein